VLEGVREVRLIFGENTLLLFRETKNVPVPFPVPFDLCTNGAV